MSQPSNPSNNSPDEDARERIERDLQENAASAVPQQLVAQITREVTQQYRGPIPPPEMLAAYDEVVPGAAERILAMAEAQSGHRREMEKTVIEGDSRRSWLGLVLGCVVALILVAAGTVVAVYANATAGATIITGTVVSLAGVFVYGQKSRREEREHKSKLMSGQRP